MEFEKKKDSDFASSYFNCMYVNIVQVVNKTKIRSVEILKRNMKNVRTWQSKYIGHIKERKSKNKSNFERKLDWQNGSGAAMI